MKVNITARKTTIKDSFRERIEKKLANEGFVAKAPAAVIEGEKAKLKKYLEVKESLTLALEKLN